MPWKHLPWLVGLLLAPLFYALVTPAGQCIIGFLFGLSLLLTSSEPRSVPSLLPWWLTSGLAVLLVLPFIPLPYSIVASINPGQAELLANFPVETFSRAEWACLGVSPAKSLERAWQLLLITSAVVLSRRAFRNQVHCGWLIGTVALAVGLIGALELLRRSTGFSLYALGSTGASTFANRNHFADWVYVGLLLSFGGLAQADFRKSYSLWMIPLLVVGLLAAVMSASRGGFAAFLGASAIWLAIRILRSRSRERRAFLAISSVILLFLLLAASSVVIERFIRTSASFEVKWHIWSDASRLFWKFPWIGIGWGGFVTAFNHWKSFQGEKTFLFVENDWLQTLLEGGILASLLILSAIFIAVFKLRKHLSRRGIPQRTLVFGAATGLLAFSMHAVVEFVFYIPATAILAAVCLGTLAGSYDLSIHSPALSIVPACKRYMSLAGSILILGIASVQALGVVSARKAAGSAGLSSRIHYLQRAAKCWPPEQRWSIALIRTQVAALGLSESSRNQPIQDARNDLNAAIAWDPFSWELRLERAWFDLAFSTNKALAASEAWECVRLNPLQPNIPLRFARHFERRDPELALDFLRAVKFERAPIFSVILEQAWKIQEDTSILWSLTPDRPETLLRLGDFAVRHKLYGVAIGAFTRLRGRADPLVVAHGFLEAGKPDLAREQVDALPPSDHVQLIHAKIQFQLGNYASALQLAQDILRSTNIFQAHPGDVRTAIYQAERLINQR